MTNTQSTDRRRGDEGFTILELSVAMAILAIVMSAVAYGMYGGMRVLAASREKTAFNNIANAEIESLRALDYEAVGVNATDPDLSTAYPGGRHNGRDAVLFNPPVADAPLANETVNGIDASGARKRYTIQRRITWTDASGGTAHVFKRLDVSVIWNSPRGVRRTVALASVFYPGNLGTVPAGAAPTASFVVTSPTPATGVVAVTPFTVDGSTSSDPNGSALTYDWNWGDGTTVDDGAVTESHVYATAGSYTVSLVVQNDDGVSSTPATFNVIVLDTSAPTASFTLTPNAGTAPLLVSVDASASADPNGDPLTYTWSFGDGTTLGPTTVATATHTYSVASNYTVTLTVSDGSLFGTTSSNVNVVDPVCEIYSVTFRNPGTNGTPNDIDLDNSEKPSSSQFVFSASTNNRCDSVIVKLPLQPVSNNATAEYFTTTISSSTTSGETRSFSATTTINANAKFAIANNQVGNVSSPSGGSALTFQFNAHK